MAIRLKTWLELLYSMNALAVQNTRYKCDWETGTIITGEKIIADNMDFTVIIIITLTVIIIITLRLYYICACMCYIYIYMYI